MSAPGLVAVDGSDALAVVVIRAADGGVAVETFTNGIDKLSAAAILHEVADKWIQDEAEAQEGRSRVWPGSGDETEALS